MNFKKIEIKSKDSVPPCYKARIDYTPLFRKVAVIFDNEAVQIPIDKPHHTSNIQRALDNEFKHAKYKAFQRTIAGQMYCFITKI